jgi:hypothetical protein
MFKNRLLISFGSKRWKVAGDWRRLHYKEFHNLYTSPNIIRVTKARRMRWAGHATCVGEMRNAYKFWLEGLKERDHSEDLT